MTINELRERIDAVAEMTGDPEAAHAEEDSIMRQWLYENTLYSVRTEFERLWTVDFPRWYA